MNTADVKEFVALDKEKAALNGRLKVIQGRLRQLDESITKQFVEDGVQSTRIDGRTVYLRCDIYASAKDGQRESVVEALKAVQLSQYVKEDYNTNSLTAYVREMIREAEDLAESEGRVITDLTEAVPAALAETLNISATYSISSRS